MKTYVYFSNHFLMITNDRGDFMHHTFGLILTEAEKVNDFTQNPRPLFSNFNGNIALYAGDVASCLENIIQTVDTIVAAGGIVENEKGEILTIFRKGYWDMPKGKVEVGEKIISAAAREVTEETGVQIKNVEEHAIITYHSYSMKRKDCLKETFWYKMKADGNQQLVPQTEEDITDIKWMTKEEFLEKKILFYPLIASILDTHFSIQ
jgi:8-oxo-dGTP pyrophosphatase MutT (NUDIX family)